jgi:hypothetical protein
VSTDDLTSLSGLEDKHARALAKQPLQITTFRELASADSDAIYRAMHRFQPRPEREDIASWQDQARSKFTAPVMDASDWQRVASFAVIFCRRQADGDWKRKLEVEQTEVEPPMPPFVESSWDCSPACDWMLEHLGQDDGGDEQIPATPASGEDQARFLEKPGGTATPHATRERLRIGSAAVIDATGQADLVQAGEMTASPPTELVSPDRVILTVTGVQPGHEVRAVARIRAHGESKWHDADPVTTDRSGRAALNLPPASTGKHDIKLLAWTPDATTYLASVQLPTVTIKSPASAP